MFSCPCCGHYIPWSNIMGVCPHCKMQGFRDKERFDKGLRTKGRAREIIKPVILDEPYCATFREKGEKETNEYHDLEFYISKIKKSECYCGADLHDAKVDHYQHPRGVPLKGYHEKQWILLTCRACGQVYAWYRLYKEGR